MTTSKDRSNCLKERNFDAIFKNYKIHLTMILVQTTFIRWLN